jgi:hypothetical protein
MEPSGRNRWQPVANGTRSKTAQTGRSATGGNPRSFASGLASGETTPLVDDARGERVHVEDRPRRDQEHAR